MSFFPRKVVQDLTFPIHPQPINEWLESQTPSESVIRTVDSRFEGVEVNESNELVPIPVIYGRRRITGPRIFASVLPSNSNILYSAIALSEGEIYGIDGFSINDEAVNIPIISDSVSSIGSGVYGGVLTVELRRGTATQAASTLLTEILGNTQSLTGFTQSVANMAYMVFKMTYAATGPYKDYPKISVNVQGRKLRNAATSGFGTEQNVLRDANPADVILDLLTNTRYGRGLADSKIDATTISSLRSSFATTVVPFRNGTPVARGAVNLAMNTGQSTLTNLKEICRQFGIMLTLSNGRYRFVPEYSTTTSVLTVNDTNVIGSRTEVYPDLNVKYNRVSVTFANELNNYNDNTETVRDATAETVDGKILDVNVNFPAITSPYLARFAAEQILRKSRDQRTYSFTMTKTGLQLTVGDVITYYGQLVRIVSMTINQDFTIRVTAVTHNNTFYGPFAPGDQFRSQTEIVPSPSGTPPVVLPPGPGQGRIDVGVSGTVLYNARGTDFYAGPYYILNRNLTTFSNSNYALDSRSFCTVVANNSFGIDTRVVGSASTYYYYMFAPYMTNRVRDLANRTLGGEGVVIANGTPYTRLYYVYEIDTEAGSQFGWHSIYNSTNNSREFFYFNPAVDTTVRRVLNGSTTSNLTPLSCVSPRSLVPASESLYGCPYIDYVDAGWYAKANDPQLALKYIIKQPTGSAITSTVRNWIIPAAVQSRKQTPNATDAGARMEIRYFVLTSGGTPIFLASQNINIRLQSPGYAGNSYVSSSRTNYTAAFGTAPPF